MDYSYEKQLQILAYNEYQKVLVLHYGILDQTGRFLENDHSLVSTKESLYRESLPLY